MKFTQKYINITVTIASLFWLNSCEDELEVRTPFPNDITFNELSLEKFTYKISDTPFTSGDNTSGIITVNVTNTGGGKYGGFALSNKNWRSYPWSLSPDFAPTGGISPSEKQAAIDSTAFSVYTFRTNRTENYLVGHTAGNDAFFSLNKPSVVEHVLVANTTYTYLLASFGSKYSRDFNDETQAYDIGIDGRKIRNIQNPNPSRLRHGRFYLPAPNDVEAIHLSGHAELAKRKVGALAAEATRNAGGTEIEAINDSIAAHSSLNTGYIKLKIEGFLNETQTGDVDFYLAALPNTDPEHPEYDFILNDWTRVDLSSLGEVDKVLFKMSSSYVDATGEMIYPPTFCLDGIRLANQ